MSHFSYNISESNKMDMMDLICNAMYVLKRTGPNIFGIWLCLYHGDDDRKHQLSHLHKMDRKRYLGLYNHKQ